MDGREEEGMDRLRRGEGRGGEGEGGEGMESEKGKSG